MKEYAYCNHLALNFGEKTYFIPVLVEMLQALQYTKQNDTKNCVSPVSLSRPICTEYSVKYTEQFAIKCSTQGDVVYSVKYDTECAIKYTTQYSLKYTKHCGVKCTKHRDIKYFTQCAPCHKLFIDYRGLAHRHLTLQRPFSA